MDPDILMDDFAIFNTVLSDADITARWDQSLTARIASSLEPNLAIFYNFNTPGVAGGTVVRAAHSSARRLVGLSPRLTLLTSISLPSPANTDQPRHRRHHRRHDAGPPQARHRR